MKQKKKNTKTHTLPGEDKNSLQLTAQKEDIDSSKNYTNMLGNTIRKCPNCRLSLRKFQIGEMNGWICGKCGTFHIFYKDDESASSF